MRLYLVVVFICVSLMVDHVERLFMCLSAICVSLEGMLFFFSVVLDSGNTLFGTFIYIQRRHTDGQQAHEKVLNITNY